ncbi:MAG: Na/Pi cotransporter family protein [Fibromonadales bacterium]|nr:Na/Pi cotransporter family protein [Fibromonadales bacterium]
MSLIAEYANILLPLAGGIGIFLLGMKFLSEGLQTIAGSKLKTLIGMATNNRLLGVGMGALVTGIIQSSSITTVLVVSFVDGGLMTLAQAVGVIMGANIGTTITAWILTIKIDQYGLPLAGIAAIIYVFCKKETIKYVALGFLGLGCVFMGLLFMKEAVEPIKDNPDFVAMFSLFHANSYLNVLKCAALGCLLTVMVQSSSVTIGITMVLATQGLIDFKTAAALVLGENVGTTVTAFLASLGANNNARRAAYFHSLFNLTGAIYITALFAPFVSSVEWGLSTFFGMENLNDPRSIVFGIAATHSAFNIFNALIFLLPCRLIARFLESSIATKVLTKLKLLRKEKQQGQAQEVEALLTMMTQTHHKESSYIHFIEIESRIKKVLNYTGEQLTIGISNLNLCIESNNEKLPEIEQIFETEKNLDKIKAKFASVLSSLVGRKEANQQKIFVYERLFDSLESASDYMAQVAKLRIRLLKNKTDLLDYQRQDLIKLNSMISEAFGKSLPILENGGHSTQQMIDEHEASFAAIKEFIRSMRTSFWNASSGNVTDPIVDDAYSNMLSSYRKIRDHLRSSGNAIFGIDKD